MMKQFRFRWFLFLVIGAAVVLFLATVIKIRMKEKIPEGIIVASGRIEGREVTIASKIQGRIKSLFVNESDTVKKDQPVAEITSEQLAARYANAQENTAFLQAQIEQAEADLAFTEKNTAASINAATASVKAANAQAEKAKTVLDRYRKDFERYSSLFKQDLVSASEFDRVKMQYETALSDLKVTEKEAKKADANLEAAIAAKDTIIIKRKQMKSAQANYRAAQASVQEIYADLQETRIYAPSDGTILSRPVEEGEVINPGAPLYVMVNMHKLYVKVYIPEQEIGKIKLNTEARVYTDAGFGPGREQYFKARVTKISEQAEFTPKNIETKEERIKLVFGVEISVDNPQGLLKPGMPADVVIRWKESAPWIKPM